MNSAYYYLQLDIENLVFKYIHQTYKPEDEEIIKKELLRRGFLDYQLRSPNHVRNEFNKRTEEKLEPRYKLLLSIFPFGLAIKSFFTTGESVPPLVNKWEEQGYYLKSKQYNTFKNIGAFFFSIIAVFAFILIIFFVTESYSEKEYQVQSDGDTYYLGEDLTDFEKNALRSLGRPLNSQRRELGIREIDKDWMAFVLKEDFMILYVELETTKNPYHSQKTIKLDSGIMKMMNEPVLSAETDIYINHIGEKMHSVRMTYNYKSTNDFPDDPWTIELQKFKENNFDDLPESRQKINLAQADSVFKAWEFNRLND